MQKLTEEQKQIVKNELNLIAELLNSPAYKAYTRAVEDLIKQETPNISFVHDANDAIKQASRLAFVSGLRRALLIVTSAKERAESFK